MARTGKRTNPYTQIAALHNQGIDFVFRKLKDRQAYSEDISFENILEIVSEYLAKIQNKDSKVDRAGNYAILANFFNRDRDKIIDEMLVRQDVPSEVIAYLEIVRSIPSNTHPEEVLKILADVERDLLDSTYTNEQIKFVLLYIAIAKEVLKTGNNQHIYNFPVSMAVGHGRKTQSLLYRQLWLLQLIFLLRVEY